MVLAVHLALAGRYDLFRDELYFIVSGQNPSFGYVDQPPLVPLLASALYSLGEGAWPLRVPVALAAAALVVLCVRFTRLLGGGTLAANVAAFACATAPVLMGLTAVLTTSGFDPFAITAITFLLVRADRRGSANDLMWAGLIAGVTLQIKYSLVLWAIGATVGLLFTAQRRIALRPQLWIGLALACCLAAPSIIWQALNGFPFLELTAAAEGKNAETQLLPFIGNQAFIMNPVLAPLWLAGLVAPFLVRRMADLRFIAAAYAVLFVIVRIGHGKDYYLAACYPALFVIGAATLSPLVSNLWRRSAAMVWLAAAAVFAGIAAPLALPILPPARLESYIIALKIAPQQQEKSFAGTVLPQIFADQLGWRAFTNQVGQSWQFLTADQRARTAILVDNYGEAAALDLYGNAMGLPPALTGHNHYYLWGLRGQDPANLIIVTDEPGQTAAFCGHTDIVATTFAPFAMAYENNKAIVWCEGLKQPLGHLWPRTKRFE